MLSVESLSKSFGETQVLKNISLDIPDGETTVILGPSGSGKSTLLRCLNLLETPQSGTLTIDGAQVDYSQKLTDVQVRDIRSRSAMVFQQFNLFPNYTALKNVALAPTLNGTLSAQEAQERARELLAKVGLADKVDSYPDALSGGQQQRVAIARALALEPSYLLFDEPTSALDPELEAEVIRVLMQLAKEGRSLVIVTHNMAFAKKVADRIVFLENGTLRYNGEPTGFFASDDERICKFLTVYDSTEYTI
ncbi:MULTISPECIES: amino acid ABC transporter ATP-binding protein [Rothia]|uniref:amino acid ABC transporter ATP-binding protein n=1 Tax=Rothia TaxID=32207 RepID=UPI00244D7508|nr:MULTISPECIES: amino acid ABC transporter ATP-binding protein [Rothia]